MSLKRSFAFFLKTNKRLLRLQCWSLLLPVLFYSQLSFAAFQGLGAMKDAHRQQDDQLLSLDEPVKKEATPACQSGQKRVAAQCDPQKIRDVVGPMNGYSAANADSDQYNDGQYENHNRVVQQCVESVKSCLKSCNYKGSIDTNDSYYSFLLTLGSKKEVEANEHAVDCFIKFKKFARFNTQEFEQHKIPTHYNSCKNFGVKGQWINKTSKGHRFNTQCKTMSQFSEAKIFQSASNDPAEPNQCEGGKIPTTNGCKCPVAFKEINGKCVNDTGNRPIPPNDPEKPEKPGDPAGQCPNGEVGKPGPNGQLLCKVPGKPDDPGEKNPPENQNPDELAELAPPNNPGDPSPNGDKKENEQITKADFENLKKAMDNAASNLGGGGNNFSDIGQVSYDNGGDFESSSNSFDEGSNVPYGTAEVNVAGVTDSVRATIPRFSGDRLIPSGPQLTDPKDKDQPPANNNRGGLGGNPNLGGGGTKAKPQKAKKAARRGRSSLWAKAKQLVTGSFFGGAPAGGEKNNSPAKKSQYQQQTRRSGGKSKYFQAQDLQRADLQKLNESFHANMPGFGQPIGKAITDVNLIRSLYADYRDNMLNRYGCEPPQTSCGVKRKRKTASSRKPSSIKKKRKRKLRRKKKRRRKR